MYSTHTKHSLKSPHLFVSIPYIYASRWLAVAMAPPKWWKGARVLCMYVTYRARGRGRPHLHPRQPVTKHERNIHRTRIDRCQFLPFVFISCRLPRSPGRGFHAFLRIQHIATPTTARRSVCGSDTDSSVVTRSPYWCSNFDEQDKNGG